jgi:hypothetical protein
MATNRQITANRKNAQKSTGPRSSVGKSATKRNALAHGLRAAEVLLPDEDESVYRQFKQEVFDHFAPANALESEFVERIVSYFWRLRRCRRVEATLLGGGAQVMEPILQTGHQSYVDALVRQKNLRPINELSHAEVLRRVLILRLQDPSGYVESDRIIDNVSNEDLAEAAIEATKEEKQRNPLTYDIALGFSESTSKDDRLSKLARYETSLDRALYRCIHELQRWQAIRMDQPASAPPTVDLNVTIENS